MKPPRKKDIFPVKFVPLVDVAKLRLAFGDVLIVRVDDKKLPSASSPEDTLYARLHSAIQHNYPGLHYIVVDKKMDMELAIKREAKGRRAP